MHTAIYQTSKDCRESGNSCFKTAPESAECIIRPELCRAHLGEGRDTQWEEEHHNQPHIVYLAVSSAVKVGVTRANQIPTRWIDQGASAAIRLAETPNHYEAGSLEVVQAEYADRGDTRNTTGGKMKYLFTIVCSVTILLTGGLNVMATEEAPYKVLKSDGIFELREYEPQILAEVIIDAEMEAAGNAAFRPLFNYISGENRSKSKIAMTAPVSQESKGEKIAMTAPVSQEKVEGKWAVSFMMPASFTMATIPVPDDPGIKLRQVPARTVAAVRYSGTWSEKKYLLNKEKLEAWLRDNKLAAAGESVWARYNSPFSLWFLRRNEILIPVGSD